MRTVIGSRVTVGGVLTENTCWQADTITVVDKLTVPHGITLSIKPGVRVEFDGYFPLQVQGRLLAEGKPDSLILFTARNHDGFNADVNTTGVWHGIRFEQPSAENDSSLLKYCRIEYSKAVKGSFFSDLCGGAVYVENFSKLRIENCRLENNCAVYGGAVYLFYNSNPEIVGCLIRDNHALDVGGALVNYYSYPKIFNNTITGNEFLNTSPDIYNSTVYNFLSKPHFYNNIVQDNQVYTHSQLVHHKFYYTWNNNIAGDSLINYNIDADPLYNSLADADFSLTAQSPCVDNGFARPPYSVLPIKDLAGNDRLYNGAVDIGAYEYSPSRLSDTTPADYRFLLTAYPNPFNPATSIKYALPQAGNVKIKIYNSIGALVNQLDQGERKSGYHTAFFNANKLPSGVYIYLLEYNSKPMLMGKMVLCK